MWVGGEAGMGYRFLLAVAFCGGFFWRILMAGTETRVFDKTIPAIDPAGLVA